MEIADIGRRGFAAILAGTAIAAALVTTAAADTTRVRMHTYYGTEIDPIAEKFRERVKEESGGTLVIQYFRGGELVPTDQLLDGVSKGTVDIIHGTGAYWSGQVDIGNIDIGLPGAWTSLEEARDVFEDPEVSELVVKAYEEAGAIFLGKGYGHDYDLVTTEPVSSLDDLKDRRIRATSAIAKVLDEFDIPTVFLPGHELYIALSTGVLDGAIYGGPVEYEHLKINEVAKHYTYMNLLMPGWTDTYLANPRKWNSLSDEHKDILQSALDQFAQDILDWLAENNQVVAEKGDVFEFATLPEEDSKALARAAVETVWKEEAARSERNARFIEILTRKAEEQGRL